MMEQLLCDTKLCEKNDVADAMSDSYSVAVSTAIGAFKLRKVCLQKTLRKVILHFVGFHNAGCAKKKSRVSLLLTTRANNAKFSLHHVSDLEINSSISGPNFVQAERNFFFFFRSVCDANSV
jgi:hypothetical protein